jgi:hypothetical protein
MDLNTALRWVDEAAEVEHLDVLGITGGEPLLFFDEVTQIIRRATTQGLNTKLVTNAFWGTTQADAHRRLNILRTAGLGAITVSTDSYHQEFVSMRNVVNVIKAASQCGMIRAVAFLQGIRRRAPIEELISAPELKDEQFLLLSDLSASEARALADRLFQHKESLATKTLIREAFVIEAGRASAEDVCYVPKEAIESAPCRDAGTVRAILPSGEVLRCCSVVAFDNPDFVIANAASRGLLSVLREGSEDILTHMLATYGPCQIAKYLEHRGCFFLGRYSGACHLCADVLRRLRGVEGGLNC